MVCRKENNVFLANVMFLIFIFTSFYIVQEPLPSPSLHYKPHYVLDIADIMPDSISGFDLFSVYFLIRLNNFGSLHLPQRVMYRILIRPYPGSINY